MVKKIESEHIPMSDELDVPETNSSLGVGTKVIYKNEEGVIKHVEHVNGSIGYVIVEIDGKRIEVTDLSLIKKVSEHSAEEDTLS